MAGVPRLQSTNLDGGKMILDYKVAVHSEGDGSDSKQWPASRLSSHGSAAFVSAVRPLVACILVLVPFDFSSVLTIHLYPLHSLRLLPLFQGPHSLL